jgi:hypothetical protein
MRFTVRRLMLVVALAGLALGTGILGVETSRRAAIYRQKAVAFGRREREARNEQQERLHLAASLDRHAESLARITEFRDGAKNAAGVAEYNRRLAERRGHEADDYARLRRKYALAAARPWLPVEPDTLEP